MLQEKINYFINSIFKSGENSLKRSFRIEMTYIWVDDDLMERKRLRSGSIKHEVF